MRVCSYSTLCNILCSIMMFLLLFSPAPRIISCFNLREFLRFGSAARKKYLTRIKGKNLDLHTSGWHVGTPTGFYSGNVIVPGESRNNSCTNVTNSKAKINDRRARKTVFLVRGDLCLLALTVFFTFILFG